MKKSTIITFVSAIVATVAFAAPRTADRHGVEAAPAAPVAQAKCAKPACEACKKDKAFTTAFGKNYVSVGGGYRLISSPVGDFSGATANLELNIDVWSSEDGTYGLDIALPLSYEYMSYGDESAQGFTFPVYFRPYYRFVVSEDLVITPFADCGIGGRYSSSSDYTSTRMVWGIGGGVEFSFLKCFSFTPKYQYLNDETNPADNLQVAGAELSWQFAENMVFSLTYDYMFMQNADVKPHTMGAKVRYEF